MFCLVEFVDYLTGQIRNSCNADILIVNLSSTIHKLKIREEIRIYVVPGGVGGVGGCGDTFSLAKVAGLKLANRCCNVASRQRTNRYQCLLLLISICDLKTELTSSLSFRIRAYRSRAYDMH